jgi:hypothetical protein
MPSEIALVKILSDSASVATSLSGSVGLTAKVYMGQLPQGTQYPAISVTRTNTDPSDVQDGVSKLDTETVIVSYKCDNYVQGLNSSIAGRAALDGVQNTSYVVGVQTIVIEQIWFVTEKYYVEEHTDKISEVFEQEFKIRVKR